MHLPALIEGQSEWPAHGQRHCNSVAIHYLLCRFGSFASRRWTPKRSRHDPLQFIKQKLASRSAKAVAFSEALASIFRQASQRIPNVLHSSCFKIMKKTQNITTYDKICILLYCVYPVRNAKIATTLNSVNVRVCVCVCVHHLNRCKTSDYCRGVWHSCPTTRNEGVGMSGKGNVAGFLYLQLYLQYM